MIFFEIYYYLEGNYSVVNYCLIATRLEGNFGLYENLIVDGKGAGVKSFISMTVAGHLS